MISSPRSLLLRCEHIAGLVIPENRKETGEGQGIQEERPFLGPGGSLESLPGALDCIHTGIYPPLSLARDAMWAHLVVHPVQQSRDHREDGGA